MSRAPAFEYFFDRYSGCKIPCRALQHRRAYGSGTDGIYANMVRRMIERQSSRKAVDRSLRLRIRRDPALAGISLHRREVNDGPSAPLLHLRNPKVSQKIDAG